MMFFTTIIGENLGHTRAARQFFGSSIALALQDGYHHEATYAGLDPITNELRRRIWWILYLGDRSTASIDPSFSLMIDENEVDTALPRET